MTAPATPPPAIPPTTTKAAQVLGVTPRQLDNLIAVSRLQVVGSYGASRLLDPNTVHALAAASFVPASSDGPLHGLAFHTGGLQPDDPSLNLRPCVGWLAGGAQPAPPLPPISSADRALAWLGWWNTGSALASEVEGLLVVQSTAGWIGEVEVVVGKVAHPSRPGFFRFETVSASPVVDAAYRDRRLRPKRGALAALLVRPTGARAGGRAPVGRGRPVHVVGPPDLAHRQQRDGPGEVRIVREKVQDAMPAYPEQRNAHDERAL